MVRKSYSRFKSIFFTDLFWVLAVSALVRFIYYSTLLSTTAVDTASYVNYHANLLKGETEALRTPVYPWFIKFVSLFGIQNRVDNVVTAQIIISFLSIILFYKIAQLVFEKRAVINAATLTYALMLPLINFDKMVLTESLSISTGLLFIYLIASYLKSPGHLKAWLLTLFVVIAIMLRPSFIYLLPLVIAFWVLRLLVFKKDRPYCFSGLAASIVLVGLVLGYSGLNEKNFGFNGISVVSNNNEMAVIMAAGITNYGNDPEISNSIAFNQQLSKSHPGEHIPGINIMKRFSPDRVHTFILNCIKNQPGTYIEYMGEKLLQLQAANIFTNYAMHKLTYLSWVVGRTEYLIFCITFNLLYFFIMADIILIISDWIKRKQTPWFRLILWLLIFGQVVVTIAGGYSEYQRLILPAIPALIIALFAYIDKIRFTIDVELLNKYPASVK